MKAFNLVLDKKESFRSNRVDLRNDHKTATKLGFNVEADRIYRDINHTSEIINLLEDIANEMQKEKTFTDTEIAHLQSEVYKITGDGDVMKLFNSLLGINGGAVS